MVTAYFVGNPGHKTHIFLWNERLTSRIARNGHEQNEQNALNVEKNHYAPIVYTVLPGS